MEQFTQVTYKSTRNAYIAKQYLAEISNHSLIACDFEVATKYTQPELDHYKQLLTTDLPRLTRIQLESRLSATALGHASHCTITHCSIAINDSEAYVFILDNTYITNLILNFLTTTTIIQVWHNASYDFRHIYYHTKKMPLVFEDTQILSKTILNHVNTWKANTGLKELAGSRYGSWGISSDNFTLSQMYEPTVIHYAAIDACATYWLWFSIQRYVESQNEILNSSIKTE